MEKTASHLSGVPGASPVPRCWVLGLEGGVGWGRSSGFGPHSYCQDLSSLFHMFPRGPPAFCCFPAGVGMWESLAGLPLILPAWTQPNSPGFSCLSSDYSAKPDTDPFCSWNPWPLIFAPLLPPMSKHFQSGDDADSLSFIFPAMPHPKDSLRTYKLLEQGAKLLSNSISFLPCYIPPPRQGGWSLQGWKGALQRRKGRNPRFKIVFGHIF